MGSKFDAERGISNHSMISQVGRVSPGWAGAIKGRLLTPFMGIGLNVQPA